MSFRKTALMTGIGFLALASIILGLFQIIIKYSQYNRDNAITEHPLASVEHSQNSNDISLDAAFDSRGFIHLLYASRDNGISYQRSIDCGQSWSLPQMLTPKSVDIRNRYKIAIIGNALYAFWASATGDLFQRVSLDNGITWNPSIRVLSDNHISYFSMIVDNQVLYLIYSGKVKDSPGTYFQRSPDAGFTWSTPENIAPTFNDAGWNSVFSMAISNNFIHIVRQVPDQKVADGKYNPRFYYIRSRDFGESWDQIREITFVNWPKRHDPLYQNEKLKVAALDNNVWVAFQNIGLYYAVSIDNGNKWSDPYEISDAQPYRILISVIGDDKAVILWIDTRNANHPFWVHIPLINVMLSWDEDPYWDNNDLYYTIIYQDTLTKSERLTPILSYAETIYDGLAYGKIGDSLTIVWSGKKKIEKYSTSFNDPFEVFYKFIYLASRP